MTFDIIREKNFYKHVAVLMVPLILQTLLSISVDTLSSMMLGSVSQVNMTIVTQANQVSWIIRVILLGFAGGTAVLAAQYWGVKDRERLQTIVAVSLRVIVVISAAAAAAVLCLAPYLMRIYSSDAYIVSRGAEYLRIVAVSYVPVGILNSLYAACRSVEKVRIILYNNLVTYALNLGINYALLFGIAGLPALGIEGIAVGAVTARLLEMTIIVVYMLRFEERIGFRLSCLRSYDRRMTRDYFKAGLPIVLHELIWSVGTSSGNMITGQLGTSVVAGYDVMAAFYSIVAAVGEGFLHVVAILTGIAIGAGDNRRVRAQTHSLILIGLGLGILAGIATLVFRGPFIGIYSLDPAAAAYADAFLLIIAAVCPFSYLEMTCMIGTLRAGGDGRTGLYADIVIMWLICIPAAALAAFRLHLDPIIVVLIVKLTMVLEGTVGTLRVLSMKWIHNLVRKE
ncbi:MAG: MATE family efflux transporter [Lachnospiraceae bacterium]|nr:MATE family efflux transporter [Lachnospiraceae bacterium]